MREIAVEEAAGLVVDFPGAFELVADPAVRSVVESAPAKKGSSRKRG